MLRPLMIDEHGRRIRKLRVSLLDACNFRCFYCMPEDQRFMPSSRWMSPEEIARICSILTDYGLEQIRVTGGEPTLRRDFETIMSALSEIPLQKLGLTTNGFKLGQFLDFLKTTQCHHINISLDSLTREGFAKISRYDGFDEVYRTILSAKNMGFNVKLNVVLMKGINDHELMDFVEYSEKNEIEVRFLELMRIGSACKDQKNLFMPAHEAIEMISTQKELSKVEMEFDSTSFNFKTVSGGLIGFIASESQPFCGGCSRWRLTADGFLRACLMSEKGVNVRGISRGEYSEKLRTLLPMKPTGRIPEITQKMNQIGG